MSKELIVSTKQIGDLILLQPAIAALAKQAGQVVDVYGRLEINEIIQLMPNARLVSHYRGRSYDRVWTFEHGFRAARICLQVRSGCKTLLQSKQHNRRIYHPLIYKNHWIRPKRGRYMGLYLWQELTGQPECKFTPPQLSYPPPQWCPASFDNTQYLLVHPTAAWTEKLWTIDAWVETIEKLHAAGMNNIVLSGGTSDWEQAHCGKIIDHLKCPIYNLAGKTSLQEFFYLVSRANSVLTVDGAAAHLAAGFRRKVLTLFGPTDKNLWHWQTPYSRALTPPNGKGPVADIAPIRVIAEAQRLWEIAS